MSKGFLYGAATSAHQVEGNNVHNDWWAWEKKMSGIAESGRAADHYHRFREDIMLARHLGHTAHRISLEWSRIEPQRGTWDRQALAHYREVLEVMRENNLTTFVSLHHFTNPQWLAKLGGWEHSQTPELFAQYAKKATTYLGDLVDFWVTINEPTVYATQSFWHGRWPPQKRSSYAFWRVIQQLARGHVKAYRMLHGLRPGAKVGLAHHVISYLPDRERYWPDRLAARFHSWWFNHRFLQMTGRAHDYLGVNFYFTSIKAVDVVPPRVKTIIPQGPVSDLGWPINDVGFEQALFEMKRYGLPIYVTENGLADAHDRWRADYIRSHLRAVERAQNRGVDVRGYLYWSLLDNFEWDLGFTPRFGLIEVDFKTMQRTVRPSAYVYRAVIEQARSLDRT